MTAHRREYVAALLVDVVGAGAGLLVALRPWQTITTQRPAPLHDDVLHVAGRTVDAAPTALALVALAGVVAVIATRGTLRRIVGVVLALAGAAIVWRSLVGTGAVSTSRARSLVTEHHRTVVVTAVRPQVDVAAVWPALSIAAGVFVLAAGVLVAWRGHRWSTMSARYESAPDTTSDTSDTGGGTSGTRGASGTGEEQEATRQRAAATLWTALDRGEDPTDANAADANAADATDARHQ